MRGEQVGILSTATSIGAALMLPPAHIELTWGVLNLIQKRWRSFRRADYRIIALAAILPDLIDKPLAIFVFPHWNATLLFAHSLLAHLGLWSLAAARGRTRRALPYLLAFSGHLIADRIWKFPRTLFWPLRGREFERWRNVGSPRAFGQAYFRALFQYPYLTLSEIAGVIAILWLVRDRKLTTGADLRRFLRTGRAGEG